MNKIVLEVDETTANLYNEASEFQRKNINYLLSEWLKMDLTKKTISNVMDRVGFEAMNKGLTHDKFQQIINEK